MDTDTKILSQDAMRTKTCAGDLVLVTSVFHGINECLGLVVEVSPNGIAHKVLANNKILWLNKEEFRHVDL